MWEIWVNLLLPQALKSCPKSNKLPNLVTLTAFHVAHIKNYATLWTQIINLTEMNRQHLFFLTNGVFLTSSKQLDGLYLDHVKNGLVRQVGRQLVGTVLTLVSHGFVSTSICLCDVFIRGSNTVLLTSRLTGLDSAALLMFNQQQIYLVGQI